ncbi:hypothetical protein YC2023_065157 [Brassica napus]
MTKPGSIKAVRGPQRGRDVTDPHGSFLGHQQHLVNLCVKLKLGGAFRRFPKEVHENRVAVKLLDERLHEVMDAEAVKRRWETNSYSVNKGRFSVR